jgi:hypothetical protein
MADEDIAQRARSDVAIQRLDRAAELGGGLRRVLESIGCRAARLALAAAGSRIFRSSEIRLEDRALGAIRTAAERHVDAEPVDVFLVGKGLGHAASPLRRC